MTHSLKIYKFLYVSTRLHRACVVQCFQIIVIIRP